MALSADEIRTYQLGDKEDYPVAALETIYHGAAVGSNGAGAARGLNAGDVFLGFADKQADNSGGAAGDINVEVKARGRIQVPVTGATATLAVNRAPVYASDDNTFTTTATSNSLIGYISRLVSGTICIVEFDAANAKAALQA